MKGHVGSGSLAALEGSLPNPISRGMVWGLVGAAAVTAIVVGAVVYAEKQIAAKAGSTPPVVPIQLSLNLGNLNQPQTVRVGDTISVSLPGKNVAGQLITYTDATTGAVLKPTGSTSNVNQAGVSMTTFTYSVVAAGSQTLTIATTIAGISAIPFTVPVTAS